MTGTLMLSMVSFTAGGTAYCVPVLATREVRRGTEVVPLPDSDTGVIGVLPGTPPVPVISPLPSQGRQILVMEVDGRAFGLSVDAVSGVEDVAADTIQPIPATGTSPLVTGILQHERGIVMVADPAGLAGRL